MLQIFCICPWRIVCLPLFVLVAQWIAHQTSDLGVAGSNPVKYYLNFIDTRQASFFVFGLNKVGASPQFKKKSNLIK